MLRIVLGSKDTEPVFLSELHIGDLIVEKYPYASEVIDVRSNGVVVQSGDRSDFITITESPNGGRVRMANRLKDPAQAPEIRIQKVGTLVEGDRVVRYWDEDFATVTGQVTYADDDSTVVHWDNDEQPEAFDNPNMKLWRVLA